MLSHILGKQPLDSAGVVRLADGTVRPLLDTAALERVDHAYRTADTLVAAGRVYGRTTGVGANRSVEVGVADSAGHGLRLLRSHAGGIGGLLPGRQVLAMLAVRINQLLAGGAGVQPGVVTALADALAAGVHPAVNEYGAVGTGDLAALAQTGLALAGEHPWHDRSGARTVAPAAVPLATGDALALISSNALTLGQAALAHWELGILLRASQVVTALTLHAVDGSLEAYAQPVHAARPYPGAVRTAGEIRRLLGAPPRPHPPVRRIQDPYGLRCFPQVHGPALEAADQLERILAVELNASAENPLISDEGPEGSGAAYHHGGFFAALPGQALEHLALAVHQTARLSAGRLAILEEPDFTGLRPFLADGATAGSGLMILEYSANAALAELRTAAQPASLGHAVLSRGVEEAASFASQSARQALRAAEAYRLILGCELVAAVRALRQR
ncbi:MAG TPA: aromatic amino acid ammonia-lyase, partial [Streptomyces sp.]